MLVAVASPCIAALHQARSPHHQLIRRPGVTRWPGGDRVTGMRYCPIGEQGRQSHNSNCGACIANILGLGCCNMECQHCRGYPNTNTKVHKYRDKYKNRYRGVATRWLLRGSPLPPWKVNSGEDRQIQNTNFLQFHSQMSFAIYSIL